VGTLLLAMDHGKAWIAFKQRLADEEQRWTAEQDRLARLEQAQEAMHTRAQRIQQIVGGFTAVNQLRPEVVEPVERKAVSQLLRPGSGRNAEAVAEARARLKELKATADAAIGQLTGPPIGVPAVDQLQEWAKQFAEARSRSFGLLLGMLASDAVPDQAAWAA